MVAVRGTVFGSSIAGWGSRNLCRHCAGVAKIKLEGSRVRAWGPPAWRSALLRQVPRRTTPQLLPDPGDLDEKANFVLEDGTCTRDAARDVSPASPATLPQMTVGFSSGATLAGGQIAVLPELGLVGWAPQVDQDVSTQNCTAVEIVNADVAYEAIEAAARSNAEAVKAEAVKATTNPSATPKKPSIHVFAFEAFLSAGKPTTDGGQLQLHRRRDWLPSDSRGALPVGRASRVQRFAPFTTRGDGIVADNVLSAAVADALVEDGACSVEAGGGHNGPAMLLRALEAIALVPAMVAEQSAAAMGVGDGGKPSCPQVIIVPHLEETYKVVVNEDSEDTEESTADIAVAAAQPRGKVRGGKATSNTDDRGHGRGGLGGRSVDRRPDLGSAAGLLAPRRCLVLRCGWVSEDICTARQKE
eukprot:TRINITY_DN64367_c0_g1_i1.p1 TRINITY_DN64367_c0_g1~~TRINITY_DN64367_c0_g1_i1.p1  ORF type:complete len:449 (-),score=86.60 TRINITY_DN64367_c0_g1_i1:8-1252(-)